MPSLLLLRAWACCGGATWAYGVWPLSSAFSNPVPALPLLASPTPAEGEADERLLRELASNRELDQKISGLNCGGGAEDAHCAALKLAWGVLLSQYGAESAAGEGEKCRELGH